MNELAKGFAHGMGYAMLWAMGLIGIPMLFAIASIVVFDCDVDTAGWIWGLTLFLYLIGSAIILITL